MAETFPAAWFDPLSGRLGAAGAGTLAQGGARTLEGGCVNRVWALPLEKGGRVCVKIRPEAPPGFFSAEASGLRRLGAAGGPRIPVPILHGDGDEELPPFLAMEFLESAPPVRDHDERLGRELALMHSVEGPAFGLEEDNFIGASPQENAFAGSWTDFFRERRLGAMLRRLEARGRATAELTERLGAVMDKLERWTGGDVRPALLHGDLWSGNAMTGPSGEPVLIDPAVHYGDSEADLAMTELFGRFGDRFYAAHGEIRPRRPGAEERAELYNLYHLMNHLLLFGLGYMSGVMQVLRRLTR